MPIPSGFLFQPSDAVLASPGQLPILEQHLWVASQSTMKAPVLCNFRRVGAIRSGRHGLLLEHCSVSEGFWCRQPRELSIMGYGASQN